MIIIHSFLTLLHTVITAYIWVVIIAAIMSWIKPDPYNPIVQILYRLTEPLYHKIRSYIPTSINGVDLTPIIVLLFLQFIDTIILYILRGFTF